MSSKIMVIGYGNPGRRDDGLGPALADAMDKLALPGVTTDADYQLTVEDAAAIAPYDCVVFADAAATGQEPFDFRAVQPSGEAGFSSHSLGPPAVLAMARDLFGSQPKAFVMAVRGYDFDGFDEHLTDGARRNLDAALHFLETWCGQQERPGDERR